MNELFKRVPFNDFGSCTLQLRNMPPPLEIIRVNSSSRRRIVADLKNAVQERCPRHPGVYGMIDAHGYLIYVGKAKNLRARLLTYFRPHSRDPKAGRILAQAHMLAWEKSADEFACVHRELELIRRWRPRCNVQGQPRSWQFTHVCLGRSPAPYAFLARKPPKDIVASVGPICYGARAREAMRWLNDWFQLRDCPQSQPMVFGEDTNLFEGEPVAGCLRLELRTCLGPCARACSNVEYKKKVRACRDFLAGRNATPLTQIEHAMREAAAREQFERAAVLRDKLVALEWLHQQLERMRQATEMGTTIYPVQGQTGIWHHYLLHGGRVVAVVPAMQNPEIEKSTDLVRRLVTMARARADSQRLPERVAGIALLASWFRRHPGERAKLVTLHGSKTRVSVEV